MYKGLKDTVFSTKVVEAVLMEALVCMGGFPTQRLVECCWIMEKLWYPRRGFNNYCLEPIWLIEYVGQRN